MKISLSVDQQPDDALPSLYRWLRDDDVSRSVSAAIVRTLARPDEMGVAVEYIDVVVSNALALSSLIVAVAGWRGSRKSPTTVRIRQDQTVIELTGDSAQDVQRVLDALGIHDQPGGGQAIGPGRVSEPGQSEAAGPAQP